MLSQYQFQVKGKILISLCLGLFNGSSFAQFNHSDQHFIQSQILISSGMLNYVFHCDLVVDGAT